MIEAQFPVQGLQSFTKRFGQSLHEPDVDEKIEILSEKSIIQEVDQPINTKKDFNYESDEEVLAVSQETSNINNSLQDFNYDSDGDESVYSDSEENNGKQEIVVDDTKTFLLEHSDILPDNAPVETINTLKALKYHIESSENRSFTNLERQLLATIVQHGIFNSNNEQDESKEKHSEKVNIETAVKKVTVEDEIKNNVEDECSTTVGIELSGDVEIPDEIANKNSNDVEHEIESQGSNEIDNEVENDQDVNKIDLTVSSMPILFQDTHMDTHQEVNPADTNNAALKISGVPESLVSRKILLPTPGSFEEVTNVLIEDGAPKNYSRPTLSIEEQKKLSKSIKSLPINDKLKKIQNSYHPDDEPTIQLFESMNKKNEVEPAYEDLLDSFSKPKPDQGPEPKYKSKTKILNPPSAEFLKRQRQPERNHRASIHSNRKNDKREHFEKDYRNHQNFPIRRKVKIQYKEDAIRNESVESNICANNLNAELDVENSRKRKKHGSIDSVDGTEYISDDGSKDRAVDILTNLITQKLFNKMSGTDSLLNLELDTSKTGNGQIINSSNQSKEICAPQNPLSNFQLPPFISSSSNPVIMNPSHLPMTPLMSHPGPIQTSVSKSTSRSNLITIDCRYKNRKSTNKIGSTLKTAKETIPMKEVFPKFPNTVDYIDLSDPKKDNSSTFLTTNLSSNINMNVEEGEI